MATEGKTQLRWSEPTNPFSLLGEEAMARDSINWYDEELEAEYEEEPVPKTEVGHEAAESSDGEHTPDGN